MHALHRPLPCGRVQAAGRPASSSRRATSLAPRAAANPPDAPPAKAGSGGSTWLATIIQKFNPTTEAPPAGSITVLDFEKHIV